MIFLILLSIIFGIIYLWMKKGLNYWKKRGVPYEEPTVLFGNLRDNFLMRKNTGVIFTEIYRKHEGYPFVGVFRSQTPCLLVRDPELIKNILVKDFKSFAHNDFYIDKDVDPILGRNPFVVKDEEWKSRRAQLTPAFTAGRMKAMFPLIEAVAERMIKYIEEQPDASNGTGLEAKELGTKFTVDNVASCAFGLEGKCFDSPKSDFRALAERFLSPGSWTGFVFSVVMMFPWLTKIIKVKLVPKDADERLLDTVRQALEYRKKNNIVRNDFLQFISQLEYSTKNLREIDITAHAASFFADGFETSSMVLSVSLFALAKNEDAQEKLRQEINTVLEEKYDGKFSYDAIQDMPYLNACFYESMRLFPIGGVLFKRCTQPYKYTAVGSDFKNISVELQPGETVLIPVEGIHFDAKYYPEPDRFIPERFLNNTNKSLFLGFGDGPRVCIGQRFGAMQIKAGIAYIIKNYQISVNGKTQYPFKYLPYYFMYSPKGGIWLNFNRI